MRYLAQGDESALAEGLPEDLFSVIPDELRLKQALDLPEGLAESDLLDLARELAEQNHSVDRLSFLGGGMAQHLSPVFVDQLLLRSEFYTAYTPYQPEIAQGTLQAIFEFQTFICQLTGMEVANASMYDGATAAAEAALFAVRVHRQTRGRIFASRLLSPEVRAVLETYLRAEALTLQWLEHDASGRTILPDELPQDLAAVLVPVVNHLGVVEDLQGLSTTVRASGAHMVAVLSDASCLGLLKAPGDFGVDVVCGEGQALGLPMFAGGPGLGIFATRSKYIRQLPGRIVGQTTDLDGRRSFVLTLSTREQHIRRGKATSNICSNQGLAALAVTIWMAGMGKQGVQELARRSAQGARAARRLLAQIPGVTLPFDGPIYNEFVIETEHPAQELLAQLRGQGIRAGLALDDIGEQAIWSRRILVAVTEVHRQQDVEALAQGLAKVLA